MKGIAKKAISMLFIIGLALTTVTTAYASTVGNTTTIKRSETVQGYDKVDASTKATFKLSVKRDVDTFKMYQLAKLDWSTANGVDNLSITWIDELREWLPTHGFTDASYETPLTLGLRENPDKDLSNGYEDEAAVIELLNAIRADADLMSILDSNYLVGYHQGEDYSAGNSTGPAVVTPETEKVGDVTTFKNCYTITNMPIGLCFVDAKGDSRTYQPVLLDLIPVQVGPTGNWYVKKALQYSLKYESVGITKTINGQKSDIVRNGEVVNYHVELDVPIYKMAENGEYENAIFNAYDEMAQGFDLITTSAKLQYVDKDGKSIRPNNTTTLDALGNMTVVDDTATYSVNMLTNAKVYYDTVTGKDVFYGVPISESTDLNFWGMVDGAFIKLGNYADTTASYTTVITKYNSNVSAENKITCTGAQIGVRDYTKSFIACTFNYDNMMRTLRDAESNAFVPNKVVIDYAAVVNEDSYVGNDENTNKVYVYYKGDSAGNIGISEDETVAWTYAANIQKVDGTTYETTQATDGNGDPVVDEKGNPVYEDPTYLEGAKFNLYRLDSVYCGNTKYGTKEATITETDYADFTWCSDSDSHASYEVAKEDWIGENGLIRFAIQNTIAKDKDIADKTTAVTEAMTQAAEAIGDYKTLDKFANKFATAENQYFKDYIATGVQGGMSYYYLPVWVDSCDKCATAHYHMQAYALFKDEVVSTNTKEGVNIVGLDPNTYLLVETTAPAGYNELSEGIQFAIYPYTEREAGEAGNSYKGFISDEKDENGVGINIENGIYDILVKNYKGLVLPSTGGMGTLIFTILGLAVMTVTLFVILVKTRKRQEADIH